MIKFFRNIRKNLITEGPPVERAGKTANPAFAKASAGRYIKYAIGEIVLVVIGILIALQINSWNQSRLERIEEKSVLTNLHEEFLTNRAELEKSTAIFKGAMNANSILMSLIGSGAEELQKYNLDSLFYESLPPTQIVFSDNAIKNIIQGGQLSIIKNPKIVQLMYQWEALAVLIKERENTLQSWLNSQLMPFLFDYVAFKEIDQYGNMPWSGKSKLKPDYSILFQQLKYENILDNVLWYHNKNFVGLESANLLIEQIIDETK